MQKRFWTGEEVEALRRRYPHERSDKLARDIGRPLTQVYNKAHSMGLKKTEVFLASGEAGRTDGKRGGATRFQKGNVSWNKGQKHPASGRSRDTQFQPGHRGGKAAEVYKPIGTERLTRDGYLERKIHDGMPLRSRWRAVHLVRWEEINGPIPKGHALVFRDGDKTNTAPENMELVTRAELMRRNSYHTRYPKEIGELIQLRGAVQRQINRRSERENKN